MAATKRSVVVGVFEDHARAQQAVNELRRMGFREDQIGVAGRGGETLEGAKPVTDKAGKVATDAGVGVAAGAGLGALWGVGILAGVLPGIGPAIAAGSLAALLSSAAVGAAAAGLAGILVGLAVPEEDAKFYESEFQAGRIIVTVHANGRYEEAAAVLSRFGAYNAASGMTAARGEAGRTIQVKEEEMRVRKQPVKTGEVRVRKEVHTEHKTIEVPVKKEEVVIERRPVSGRPVSSSDLKAGEEMRIPVREEQVHVEKTPVVKEEVTVGKRQVTDTERVSGTVRKEEVKVEKKGDVDVRSKGKKST